MNDRESVALPQLEDKLFSHHQVNLDASATANTKTPPGVHMASSESSAPMSWVCKEEQNDKEEGGHTMTKDQDKQKGKAPATSQFGYSKNESLKKSLDNSKTKFFRKWKDSVVVVKGKRHEHIIGGGVFITKSGWILSVGHVLSAIKKRGDVVQVVCYDGSSYIVEESRKDSVKDLALLKVTVHEGVDINAAMIFDGDLMYHLTVYFIGHPSQYRYSFASNGYVTCPNVEFGVIRICMEEMKLADNRPLFHDKHSLLVQDARDDELGENDEDELDDDDDDDDDDDEDEDEDDDDDDEDDDKDDEEDMKGDMGDDVKLFSIKGVHGYGRNGGTGAPFFDIDGRVLGVYTFAFMHQDYAIMGKEIAEYLEKELL